VALVLRQQILNACEIAEAVGRGVGDAGAVVWISEDKPGVRLARRGTYARWSAVEIGEIAAALRAMIGGRE
jgi:hypothetical protein